MKNLCPLTIDTKHTDIFVHSFLLNGEKIFDVKRIHFLIPKVTYFIQNDLLEIANKQRWMDNSEFIKLLYKKLPFEGRDLLLAAFILGGVYVNDPQSIIKEIEKLKDNSYNFTTVAEIIMNIIQWNPLPVDSLSEFSEEERKELTSIYLMFETGMAAQALSEVNKL